MGMNARVHRMRHSRMLKWLPAAAVVLLLVSIVFVHVCIPTTAHAACSARVVLCEDYLGFDDDEYRCGSLLYVMLCWWEARNDPAAKIWRGTSAPTR